METRIRPGTIDDAAGVAAVYAPYVLTSPATFEMEPPSPDEMARRIQKVVDRFPWLVAEDAEGIVGYAYGGLHRERPAYRWTAEVSVYIAERAHGKGVGRALYTRLLGYLRAQGYFRVVAGITLPNKASVGLHQAMGFEPVGVYKKVGYKLGVWHDTGWWQLELRPPEPDPAEPKAWLDVEVQA